MRARLQNAASISRSLARRTHRADRVFEGALGDRAALAQLGDLVLVFDQPHLREALGQLVVAIAASIAAVDFVVVSAQHAPGVIASRRSSK